MDNLTRKQVIMDASDYQRILAILSLWGFQSCIGKDEIKEKIDDENRNLLHIACYHSNANLVKICLDIGIDINSQEITGNNCLHILMKDSHNDMEKNSLFLVGKRMERRIQLIKSLLMMGADYKRKNFEQQTPLDLIAPTIKPRIINFIKRIELR